MNEPPETSELLAFAKSVESKSLSRAAAELGVPRATISRRLARLEERLGVRLLRRTTRSLALTEAGRVFYRHARIALDAVGQAEQSVRHDDEVVRGSLRVSLPPLNDASLFAMLTAFVKTHPHVNLSIHFSTQLVDLHRGGYDVALRAASSFEPGLVARTIVRESTVAVASPGYLKARGVPRAARDLRSHTLLLGFARGELPQTHWTLIGGRKLRVEGSFATNDVVLLREAALDGLGIALLPMMMADSALRDGSLVHVLPRVVGGEARIAVVYPEREFVPPQLRAFVDTVTAWAKTHFPTFDADAQSRSYGEAKSRKKPARSRSTS